MTCYNTGPFRQTLFLGCSIRDFTMNSAWGADSSNCKVGLIYDGTPPMNSVGYNAFKTEINSLTNKTQDIDTSSTAFDEKNLNPSNDPSKSLFRNIAQQLNDKNNATQNTDSAGAKIFYDSATGASEDWYYGDPGFIADFGNTDIIGCPVKFRFDNLSFAGLISNWTYGSKGLIEVEIENFARLLKNTTLILQHYVGSISTTIGGTDGILQGGLNVAVPSLEGGSYDSSIYQGNSPNILNVFGALDGAGWTPAAGMSAAAIYDALVGMLDYGAKSSYNPYGGLVAKTPFNRDTGTMLQIGGPGGAFFRVNSSSYWCRGGNCPNTIGYEKLGLIPTVRGTDGFARSLIRVSMENVPRPPNGAYINDNSMSLMDFIDYCFDNAGSDYTIGFSPDLFGGNFSGSLGFGKVSRRSTASLTAIKDFVNSFSSDDEAAKITEYKYGQEFNEGITKSVIIGGKQKRLHQMTTINYNVFRHARVFEPSRVSVKSQATDITLPSFQNPWVDIYANSRDNRYFQPNVASTRPFDSSQGNPWTVQDNAVVAQSANNFWSTNSAAIWGGQNGSYGTTTRGNYKAPTFPLAGLSWSPHNDLIAPFFGIDGGNAVRETHWDPQTRQLYVQIRGADLGLEKATGYYGVSETELRYTASFQSWFLYTSYRFLLGKPSNLGSLLYDEISYKYGTGTANRVLGGGGALQTKVKKIFTEKYSADYGPALGYDWPAIERGLRNLQALGVLSKVYDHIAEIARQHYGKTFMVRIPMSSYTDSAGQPLYSHTTTDGAWEELGTSLDDLMTHGDSASSRFLLADGRIMPFFGFNSSVEWDRPERLTSGTGGGGDYYPLNLGGDNTVTVYYEDRQIPNVGYTPGLLNYAHGGSISPGLCSKTYTSCTPYDKNINMMLNENKNVVYTNGSARAVYEVPGASYESDHGVSPMIHEVMAQVGGNPIYDLWNYVLLTGLNDENGMTAFSRAALPVFAAIPITHTFAPYGPWASHPGAIANSIFATHGATNVNNLVGGTSVEIDEGMVPWEYGGSKSLDYVGLLRAGAKDKYEQVVEYGSLTTANIVLGDGLGSKLDGVGPYITSVNVNVNGSEIRATYNFRTFTKKIGFYNKEITENIRTNNRLRLEANRKAIAMAQEARRGGY